MGLPRPDRLARLAAGAALHATATGVGLAAGTATLAGSLAGSVASTLLAPPARTLRDVTTTLAEAAVDTAVGARPGRGAGRGGAGHRGRRRHGRQRRARLAEAGKAMFEPPAARRSRRVWVSGGRAHLELAAPAVEGGPSVRRALRRQLERLDGVEWAAVNDAVGRVLVTFDERRRPGGRRRRGDRGRRAGARRHAGLPAEPGPSRRPRTAGGRAGDGGRRHRRDRVRLRRAGAAGAPAHPARDARAGAASTASSGSRGRWSTGSAPRARTWPSTAPARCCTR